MEDFLNAVNEFHTAFKVGEAPNELTVLDHKTTQLRVDLMQEELNEYEEAAHVGDIVEIADALGDQLYILCGSILKHGLQDKIKEVFFEIHKSNMSKLDKDGNPIFREDEKVLKSEQYFKPNIKSIING
jgi:predicted HAD superfamily Cof-like phosphohydrolase